MTPRRASRAWIAGLHSHPFDIGRATTWARATPAEYTAPLASDTRMADPVRVAHATRPGPP
jgi:hypothetical protein